MKRFSIALTCLMAMLAIVGCNEAGPDIDRVQTSLVDKSIFEGEWYYGQTVIDVDGDEAAGIYSYEGEQPWGDRGMDGSDYGLSPSMPLIRWVVDEDYLFAYRAYELQDGGNDDGRAAEYRGQPLAAWPITRHVDLRYDYNPTTGERTNVSVEDGSDRRWYERKFMYVDWSQNMISDFNGIINALNTSWAQESAPFFFEDSAHSQFPTTWAPQFVRVGEDPDFRWAEEWPSDEGDTVHYMSFVTQNLASPGANCLYYGGFCQTYTLTIRHAFLRQPPNHEYAVETQSHQEYDRFGVFRTWGRTYVRGNEDVADLARRCTDDLDCGVSGTCDTAAGICVGGISRDYGDTDFLNFYRPRFNFWSDSLREDTSCVADWQCNDVPGSVCDRAAEQCTVPFNARPTRRVAYHLNPGYPKHLVKAAFEVIGNWNESFMRGQRAVTGAPMPQTEQRVTCQDDNPTAFCWCGSPEATGGTCKWQYDPFMPPEVAESTYGVSNPYLCHIQGPEGWTEPASPTSYDDYPDEVAYQYEFVGDECLLVLESNSCDKDNDAACEDLGDIRYQFFNYIPHGGLFFGGVAAPLVDPTTGELITSNANMGGTSIESVGTYAQEFFPALRCANEELGCAPGEEGADLRYTTGENVREYYSNLGNTARPVAYQPSGTDGYSLPVGGERPALPAEGMLEYVRTRFEAALPKIERLRGAEGRALIMSDRRKELAGTSLERRLVGSLGQDGQAGEAVLNTQDIAHLDPTASFDTSALMGAISPMRDGVNMVDLMPNDLAKWRHLGNYNIDPPFDIENLSQRQRYWEYWAEAFRGRSLAEGSIRMQQAWLRAVMHHEVGHCVGLRHNFASSFDRDNYFDGALEVMFANPLPDMTDYDDPALGGDASGSVNGPEIAKYYDDLRNVRNLRADSGMYNYTSASTMEYAGDLSDMASTLGRYDVAASVWNHFNMVEAYVGDPRNETDDTLDDALRSHEHDRAWWQSYRGGESCDVDAECPYAASSAALPTGQPVYQRCIKNTRVSRLPAACGGDDNCVCSSFDEDFLDYVDGVGGFENDVDGDDQLDHYPVKYLFCSDVRAIDVSWCSRFDAGESFQEVIDHFRRGWEETYPRAYYRRFRRTALSGGASIGSIIDAAKIYQHLFFRYFYDPGFASDTGPLGFEDQYFASIDAMHWLTELVNLPNTGSYVYDAGANSYEWLGEDYGMTGSDITLETGQGYPLWSKYQDGYSGFFRMERAGVFWDKFYALLALAIRDWGLSFTIDERFYINFYDLFGVEMTEFFGGIMIGDERWYAPRVEVTGGEAQVQHMSLFRDLCRRAGVLEPCRGSQETVYTGSALGGTVNPILRDWASMLALAEFPVFYDTSFEQRAQIFKLSSGEGWDVPDTQPDGSPTCAYGAFAVTPSHDTGCTAEEADYVVFESERFHTPYIAVKVRSRLNYNLEEEQLGFYLLERAVNLQTEVEALRAITAPTDAEIAELHAKEDKLQETESFLEYLIDLQRRYGISSYL